MSYKIDYRSHGDCTDDNFYNQVNGDIIVNSVAEDGKKHNSRHNADYRREEVASEAALWGAPEKAYKVNGENGECTYGEQSKKVIVELHIKDIYARLCFC